MAQIKLRFLTTSDPVSAIIRWQTDCAYSHVEYVLDDDWAPALKEQSYHGLMPGGPSQWTIGAHIDGGVKLRPLNYGIFTAQETLAFECTAEQKAAIIADVVKAIGSPYSCLMIAGILFHFNVSEKGHFICSLLGAKPALDAGVNLLRIPPNAVSSITPRDLFLSPLLKSA